jgi:hypothetical protein
MHRRKTALIACLALGGCSQNDPEAPEVRAPITPTRGTPGYPGAGAGGVEPLGGQMVCFYGSDPVTPAATVEYVLEVNKAGDQWHVRLTFDPGFVDNTYGSGSIGWSKKGHRFDQLVKSDHAELVFEDASGATALQLKTDYLSEDSSATSGYGNLGVAGGDGRPVSGDAGHVVMTMTSMDRNLNERGYAAYVVDSPPTDASYTASAEAPDWDYRVVYEMWIHEAAFAPAGFGAARLDYVHASPSKQGGNTLVVVPRPCPDDWVDPSPDVPARPIPDPEDCPAAACSEGCPPGHACVSGCCTQIPL